MTPVLSRSRVVFDMISIVEERKVIRGAVVTRCRAASVFKVAVEIAKAEAERVAGNVDRPEKVGREEKHQRPQCQDEAGFHENRRSPMEANELSAMMRQMAIVP